MNEQDVRALVREAIERHLGRPERSAKAEHYDRPAFDTAPPVRSADLQVSGVRGADLQVGGVRSADLQVGRVRSADLQVSGVRSADLQVGQHASHILLKISPGSDVDEGMCVIEPRVRCNHCGFCQSYGH
jgi:hypothetical protein